jgi:DNA-directed RNA polymerase specialized sigma24 family protein
VHAFALFSSIQRHAAAAMAAAVTITTTTNEYINRRRKREREREGKEIVACVVNSKVVKLIS